jgi:hypothetical protein
MPRMFAAVAMLLVPLSMAGGQEGRYVPIPFQGNFETLFKERLRAAKDQPLSDFSSTLQELFKRVQKDPQKFTLDPATQARLLSQLATLKPELRDTLTDMMAKHPVGATWAPPELEGLKKVLKKNLPDLNISSLPKDLPLPNFEAAAKIPVPRSDRLSEWLRDLASRTEDTTLGDWLRSSPSFQKGLEDLNTLAYFDKPPSIWGLDNLPENLRLPSNLNLGLGKGMLDGLTNISLPEMPRVSLPRFSLGRWNAPALPLPNLGGAGGAHFGEALLWALVVGGTLLLAWHLAKNLRLAAPRPSVQVPLGPWPVDPAKVATRAQLIRAFDYLAILLLGTTVRSWNHRAIARKLTDSTLQGTAAVELARIYEQARYTPGPDLLSAEEQAAVRHHLCVLAGVPAS